MKEINIWAGMSIDRACALLIEQAPAFMIFNDIRVEARPGETVDDVYKRWWVERDRRTKEWQASEPYRRQRIAELRAELATLEPLSEEPK